MLCAALRLICEADPYSAYRHCTQDREGLISTRRVGCERICWRAFSAWWLSTGTVARVPAKMRGRVVLDDLRIAIRRAMRSTGTSLTVVLLLSLAIAVNACVFSVAYGMLWKPLPYRAQDSLVQLTARSTKMGIELGWSIPYLDVIARNSRQLEDVGAYRRKELALVDPGGNYTGVAEVLLAEPQLFALLGASPEIGRLPGPDDAKPNADPVALISHDFWQSRFGASASVLDQKVRLAGRAYRIVGVLPRSFAFPDRNVQVVMPMGFSAEETAVENAGSFGDLHVIGRLKPSSTMRGASSEISGLVNGNETLKWVSDQIGLKLDAQPLRTLWLDGRENSLKSMLVAALLVFVVTVANIYNVFMLRLLKRRQELALLEAVGATKARRSWQITLEAAVLGVVATIAAIAIAPAGFAVLRGLDVLPTGIPQSIGLDGATAFAVLAMCVIASIFLASSSLVFSRQNVFEVLRQTGNGQTAGSRIHLLRQGLVIGQLAVTFILLFATLLLIRSSHRLLDEDVGFDRSGQLVGTLQPSLSEQGLDPEVIRAQMAAWVAAVAATSDVESVALTSSAPFSKNVTLEGIRAAGIHTIGEGEQHKAYISYVSADYPRAVGLRIVGGRMFTTAEAERRAPVALVDSDIARRYFPEGNPIGRTIGVAGGSDEVIMDVTIVGVVAKVRQRTLANEDEYPSVYLPSAVPFALPGLPLDSVEFVVRTDRTDSIEGLLIQQLRSNAPSLRLTKVVTMESRIDGTIIDFLRLNTMLQLLSAVTVLLTAVGLYALLAHSVEMRRREFGIRQALGASTRDLLLGVLAQGSKMIVISFAFGVPTALLVGSILKPRLHDAPMVDMAALLVVCMLLSVVGLAANLIPAYRASRVSPMEALRSE